MSYAGLQVSVFFALKVLVDSDSPSNHGMLAPIEIKAPLGTIVNADFPAATAARAQTCQRIVDVIFGALVEALPDRIMAAGNGANTTASFSGTRAGRALLRLSRDHRWGYRSTFVCRWGGWSAGPPH